MVQPSKPISFQPTNLNIPMCIYINTYITDSFSVSAGTAAAVPYCPAYI
jgi:hypothetical protein